MSERLNPALRPVQFGFHITTGTNIAIARARNELAARAELTTDRCFGYFPGCELVGIEQNLPASKGVNRHMPRMQVGEHELSFNFLRLALRPQPPCDPWHLDSDAATAVTGDREKTQTTTVWRALLNLSVQERRVVEYLDVDPSSVGLVETDGYISLPDTSYDEAYARRVILPPKDGLLVCGVLFAASQVLHRGNDGQGGHFVGGYGAEVAA